MADKIIFESWSAIVPVDFGLKAGYQADDGTVSFRAIIGWVTATQRDPMSTTGDPFFVPIALGELFFPTFAALLPGFLGVFPENVSDAEALALVKAWTVAGKIKKSPAS
jgi:hypothetical protein